MTSFTPRKHTSARRAMLDAWRLARKGADQMTRIAHRALARLAGQA